MISECRKEIFVLFQNNMKFFGEFRVTLKQPPALKTCTQQKIPKFCINTLTGNIFFSRKKDRRNEKIPLLVIHGKWKKVAPCFILLMAIDLMQWYFPVVFFQLLWCLLKTPGTELPRKQPSSSLLLRNLLRIEVVMHYKTQGGSANSGLQAGYGLASVPVRHNALLVVYCYIWPKRS